MGVTNIVVIQQLCTFMGCGGKTLDDGVIIAPNVNLTTRNHDFNPENRSETYAKLIHIKKNVGIGISATILPGVTIGENSIVGVDSVVTKEGSDNTSMREILPASSRGLMSELIR